MDTMSAFARGEASRWQEMMVFDWDKAARLIKEKKPSYASAGLRNDWEWTGGEIYKDGKIVSKDDTYTFLASTWAVPELDLDGEVLECFKMKHDLPRWDSGTYWPESARKILQGG